MVDTPGPTYRIVYERSFPILLLSQSVTNITWIESSTRFQTEKEGQEGQHLFHKSSLISEHFTFLPTPHWVLSTPFKNKQ